MSYSVPSMTEIRETPPNGFRVASTFSGCGGSCLGFRMAGFEIAYASEFVEAARETYRANASPETFLDARDVREVKPEEILEAAGPVDVLEGSPPCSAFSPLGSRDKGWGSVKVYSDTRQRVDDLFFEFIRLAEGLRPKLVVAENVAALASGRAVGLFREILNGFDAAGYAVEGRILDAQWLGVPQTRKRLILIGVEKGSPVRVRWPEPFGPRVTLGDAVPWLSEPESGPEVEPDAWIGQYAIGAEWGRHPIGKASTRARAKMKYFQLARAAPRAPVPAITATGGSTSAAAVTHPFERRKFSIAELRRICSFPDDFVLTGTYREQYERLGRSVPPLMARAIATGIRQTLEEMTRGDR